MTAQAWIIVVVAFGLGSILGAQLMGRLRGLDLRSTGSGNLGATNALRAGGRKLGLAVLVIDICKGFTAAWALPQLSPEVLNLSWWCGGAAVVGHVYSPFAKFHGGKGAATLVGVYLALLPVGLVLAVPGFAAVLMLTGYVSLSVMCGGLLVAFYVACMHPSGLLSAPGAFAAALFLFLLWTHRANLLRLANGSESRFEKAMLLRR